ncbi:MAG TPA: patatin-like phospholipase family protein [Acidimicrobiales bacterium]|nr:patatin-like phospholipase family protein [Acidimicrobiales bacterium]
MPDRQDTQVVLVLQGGGALGAYHVGAYQAMQEAGYAPDWVSGISIGAINSAVIAGTEPERRLARLEELWDRISRPDEWGSWLPAGPMRRAFNTGSAAEAFLFGQPNFFTPNAPSPYLAPPGSPRATAFYDTSPMVATLEQLCDFDLVNDGATRLSLGATSVTTGQFRFFQNFDSPSHKKVTIGPEHVLASGSLPPGFPFTMVDGEPYWDGGVVSNTPLDAIVQDLPAERTLVFMIDLWNAAGRVPATIDEVLWRQKQIQYASRTAYHIESVVARHNLARQLGVLGSKVPAAARKDPAIDPASLVRFEQGGTLDIVHLVYEPDPDEVSASDAEFSRPSIARRREAGYHEMARALDEAPWFADERRPRHAAAVVHQVAQGRITQAAPAR